MAAGIYFLYFHTSLETAMFCNNNSNSTSQVLNRIQESHYKNSHSKLWVWIFQWPCIIFRNRRKNKYLFT